METKAFGIQSPESLAKEYGGNKQKIAKAVQLGILDPTAAVLAGMFIDRVRNAAQEEQGPQTTVAQQVLGGQPPASPGPPPGPPQAGLQAAAPPPMRMAYGGQVGVSNNQVPAPAMERGLDGIPIPDNMFDYADGGMVAFGSGGDVQRFQTGNLVQAPTTEFFLLQRLLRSAIANNASPEKIAEIQAALNAASSKTAAPAALPAAAPIATPPAAGEGMRKSGINLPTALQQLNQPINIPKPDYAALQTQAKEMYPDVNIAAPDRDRIATEQLEAAKKFGYDPNLTATQKTEYETEREGLKTQRKEAADMALLTAGLKILGGTSPFAAVNIGKGASEAVQEFGKDVREIQKLNVQLRRDQQALERAANQDALQRSDKTEAAYRDAVARKEATEQKVLDRRASTFNSLLQGEYGNLREMAQQTGQNIRQIAASLTSTEVAGINAAATREGYGTLGNRLSDAKYYTQVKNTRDLLKKQLDALPSDDPNRAAVQAKFEEADLLYNSIIEAVEKTRGTQEKAATAGAATTRAEVNVSEEKRKIESNIRLYDEEYKRLKAKDPEAAKRYLETKTTEKLSKISAFANKPAAPAASSANPLGLNLPGR